ncbi:phytanoyl-CoA dioxygenase family protein [Sphingobium vermicomposti]|uniref:Ectoine hydroxylase-related dioxygenase (Phytanoyl-CoA dioxygenase family) n=1 Tax=Sphingobium vermicomposti TaxID=529005 RepID=A0A846MCM3_9SPHN|nr:phytanoyl-CoA dioxygenase family protein [Sphingobium vermicomposti]NIJ17914.1 ectoine hydroxylase-related dioxygenase (phytanoyl-CoA dioxygenase family) [Sphingobium vermicomposti]
MSVGNTLSVDEYKVGRNKAAMVVPVDFQGPLPQPTPDLETAKANLERAGYAILTGAVLPDKVELARQVLASEIAKEEAADVNRVSQFFVDPDAKNRRLDRLPDRHPVFLELLEQPVLLDMVKHILGPTVLNESYLVQSLDANVTHPGSGAQFIHLDGSGGTRHQAVPYQARFIWCLDAFDEENGATRVVPGSHQWNDRVDISGATFYESVPAVAPAGSLIIYTDMLLHGTGANISADRQRASINFGYCPPWCRPLTNFPLVLDPRTMEGASRTLRQLLAYSSVVNGFDYPWNSASEELRSISVPATIEY